MSLCARPGCFNAGTKSCSICLREYYCSSDCQKGDWRVHKLICKTIKKLSLQIQSNDEVCRVFDDLFDDITMVPSANIRFLGHLVFYIEYQFGDRVLGKDYRERGNGEHIPNWDVEILIVAPLYRDLIRNIISNQLVSRIVSDNLSFLYYEKMQDLLQPWSLCLDSNSTSRTDDLDKSEINLVLELLSFTERGIGSVHTHRNQFLSSEEHCERAISYARLYEGEEKEKTRLLCYALRIMYELQTTQENHTYALVFATEAYNCAAITYNPVHPDVMSAAHTLIACLTHKGDLDDAVLFAQFTLDNLRDSANGLNQLSEAVAAGYYDLANVIFVQKKGNYVNAEKLIRESLRIRAHNNNLRSGHVSVDLLASILSVQGKLGSETKELQERSLAYSIKTYGPDGLNTAAAQSSFGGFYIHLAIAEQNDERKKEYFRQSRLKYYEASRIYQKIFGPDHSKTKDALSTVSYLSIALA